MLMDELTIECMLGHLNIRKTNDDHYYISIKRGYTAVGQAITKEQAEQIIKILSS
jgi:hypothetical protein